MISMGSLWFGQSKSWGHKDASLSLLHTLAEAYQISVTESQGHFGYGRSVNVFGDGVAMALK
jgi:hypothetical protein